MTGGIVKPVFFERECLKNRGFLEKRHAQNLQDFALGGRSIPWWAVLGSIIAAETSAATFLGTPAEGFKTRGYFYGQLVIGTILARIVVAYTFLKPFYDYRVQSVYEFLTVRFGTKTKNMASGIFLFTRVLGIGVRLYLGGAIMVVIWRYLFPSLPINLNTYVWGIVFVTVITTIYTAVGGIKAVVWTDLIQAILMIGSVILAIFLLLKNIPGGLETVKSNLGGWSNVKLFQTGWNSALPFGQAFKAMLEFSESGYPARIRQPVLIIAAGFDAIVSTPAIDEFSARLRAGSHLIVPGARHELLMEQDRYRSQVFAAFDAFVPGTPLFK
jgi:Na+/proline symporter